ncbi:MAG: hypothetical protein WAZ98_10110 [Cyclobacteriaceae bacterium]
MRFISLLILLWLLLSCGSKENSLNPKLIQRIAYFSDSTFFTDISNIDNISGYFFLSDKSRGQIFQLDENLKLQLTYGKSGDGPGEFSGLLRFAYHGDSIFAVNEGKQTIEVFVVGNPHPQRTIHIPNELLGSSFEYRFFLSDLGIVASASEAGAPISVFDSSGTSIKKWGESFEFNNSFQNRIRNYRFLFSGDENQILSVSDNMPFIETYSFDGKLMSKTSIKDAEPIKERNYFIEQQNDNAENTYYRIFRDSYYDDGKLYLLCISGKEEPVCNQILEYSIKVDRVDYIRTISLPGAWYSSICVYNNLLLAFETTKDEVELYEF